MDSHAEFRTFTASGRLEAVQVLPVNGSVIPQNLLATVLRELTGNEQYQIQTRSIKSGVKVECGTTSKNGDILVYRSNRGTVQAFVVSVK